jgi:hypothetical protein
VDTATHVAGRGRGTVELSVENSTQVPQGHRFSLTFVSDEPDRVRATRYVLADSTSGEVLYRTGNDFTASGRGPVGAGILATVGTPFETQVDTAASVFEAGSPTDAKLSAGYEFDVLSWPIDLRRPGFPEELVVRFSADIVDTGVAFPFRPAKPARFRVLAVTDSGETPLDFYFKDDDNDRTLSRATDEIKVLTRPAGAPVTTGDFTWRIQLDPSGPIPPTSPPGAGDVWRLRLRIPFEGGDRFEFTTRGESGGGPVAAAAAEPYAVPNPYVGAASFEPALFNIKGRGERRIEFRNIPQGASLRIYNVHGDLVRTLRHDGSLDGYVAWDLRTKDNLDVAPGLYVFHVEAAGRPAFTGKLAVVK